MSLLPQTHAEFHSKQYWDDFFAKRGSDAFEWYGEYAEMTQLLHKFIRQSDRLLAIGCGNSNFSFDLFDAGYTHITNIDFSELVIEEMRRKDVLRYKHLSSDPFSLSTALQWIVGDMTQMSSISDSSYQVILDKGALDALVSANQSEIIQKAFEMYKEINRILTENGRYLCITLAESFIFDTIVQYFMNGCWEVSIYAIETVKQSPFIPLLVVISKISQAISSDLSPSMSVHFDQFGNMLTNPLQLSSIQASERIVNMQQYRAKYYSLGSLQIGRFETLQLWANENTQLSQKSTTVSCENEWLATSNAIDIPRFTIFLFDATDCKETTSLSMAVFMVPFGRESEYQFTTAEGLKTIADQANCRRLLSVCCNRPHIFPEIGEIQKELDGFILQMRLKDMDSSESIPYMALNDEADWEVISEGNSVTTGRYIIEEMRMDEEEKNAFSAVYRRRLIFLKNQNFIQTEVQLIKKNPIKCGSKKKKSKDKGNPAAICDVSSSPLDFDYSFLDDHHRAMLLSLSFSEAIMTYATEPSNTTGNAAINKQKEGRFVLGLVIGLGGGALPMCIQRYLPSGRLIVCDIDSDVESIARNFFGFKTHALRTQVSIVDGLNLLSDLMNRHTSSPSYESYAHLLPVSSAAGEPLDYLVIDADSKDVSLGISAPPVDFLSFDNLLLFYRVLAPGGVLVMNVVARAKDALDALEKRISHLYLYSVDSFPQRSLTYYRDSKLFKVKPSPETVNICLVFHKGKEPISLSADKTVVDTAKTKANAPKTSQSFSVERTKSLETWLKV